jgi:DNA-binding PadR family transcriptional regulator
MGRNNVKLPSLSRKEALIVELLLERPNTESYGLELVRESRHRLKRGTVYVTLSRLEDKGFIESREDTQPNMSGMPRRLYRVTGYGQRVYGLLQEASEARQMVAQSVGAL